MKDAVIVSAVRTPVGKAKRGGLATVRPDEMAATTIQALLKRTPNLDPAQIEDVVIGCAFPEGEQGLNMARMIALRAGLPDSVPAETINRYCASEVQSIAPVAYAIQSGQIETGIAGGALTVHRARKGGALRAVLYEMSGNGYGGRIVLLMAVDVDGRVVGVRVTKHTETPGLGDKIEVARNDWIRSFDGKSLQQPEPARWAVKKDGGVFDQFAGATITPRAVVGTVRKGLEFFAAHRAELIGDAAPAGGGQ